MKLPENRSPQKWLAILLPVLFIFSSAASAQNVTGYGSMPDPTLFLLREPAVHFDLKLDPKQLDRLYELNDSLDTAILGSRNKAPSEETQQKAREVNQETIDLITEIFSKEQLVRLTQISYRLKGMSFVLIPEVAKKLDLTTEQQEDIQSVVDDVRGKISKVQSREFKGAKAERESQRVITAARKEEQENILAILDNTQKREFVRLVGEPFDNSSLGAASFKAPELVESGQWVNSEPAKLSDFKGKVVALHFFAFG